MASGAFEAYLAEINKAYLRGDATEDTHRAGVDYELTTDRLGGIITGQAGQTGISLAK